MTKVQLQSYSNNHYYAGANPIKRMCWYFINAIVLNSQWFPFSSVKIFFLKAFGATVGTGVTIKPMVNIKYPWFLKIGDHVWVGEGVWIDNLAFVSISDNVCLSQGAMLLTGNHNYKSPAFDLITTQIILEDGVWIGAKAVVCPGVRCGNHSVLTVASVATNNLEPYGIYQGNPAVKIKVRTITKLQ
jgi:putative colanic acid biosynthesis acetyltransferase WcaF